MSRTSLLLGPLIGLLVGLGLGWVLFSGRGDRTESPADWNRSQQHEGTGLLDAASSTDFPHEPVDARRVEPNLARPGHPAGSIPRQEFVPDADTITVGVFTRSGDPVPDTRVSLLPNDPGLGLAARVAQTDATGRVRFGVPAVGAYSVLAHHPNFRVKPNKNLEALVQPGTEVRLMATALELVRVQVLGPEGREPDLALIETFAYPPQATLWSPEQPEIGLSPGHRKIRALIDPEDFGRLGRVATAASEYVAVYAPTATDEPVQLTCQTQTSLIGRVKLQGMSLPYGFFRTLLAPGGDAQPLETSELLSGSELSLDPTGLFRFSNLEPGPYTLGLGRIGVPEPDEVVQLEILPGKNRYDFVLDEAAGGTVLVVRVRDPEGRPVNDVELNFVRKTEGRLWNRILPTTPRGEGLYHAFLVPTIAEELETRGPEDEFFLQLRHTEFADSRLPLQAGQTELEVTLDWNATLSVTCTGLSSELSPRDLYLSVSMSPRGRGVRIADEPSEEGAWEFEGLNPGVVTIQVLARSEERSLHTGRTLVTGTSELVSGVNRFVLELPPLHTLIVEAPELLTGTQFELASSSVSPTSERTWIDSDREERVNDRGELVFELVPPGSYHLAEGTTGQGMMLKVPGGPYRYEPRSADGWRLAFDTESGSLHEAGLRNGDFVISVDGRRVTDGEEIQLHHLLRVDRIDPIRFEVERDGVRVELFVDPVPRDSDRPIYGSLIPWHSKSP